MWIRTRLASASISLEARAPTKDDPIATRESLSFELLPADDHHLDLDTGEVFQNSYSAKNEKKLIDVSIIVRPKSRMILITKIIAWPIFLNLSQMTFTNPHKFIFLRLSSRQHSVNWRTI